MRMANPPFIPGKFDIVIRRQLLDDIALDPIAEHLAYAQDSATKTILRYEPAHTGNSKPRYFLDMLRGWKVRVNVCCGKGEWSKQKQ
jgi:hypothetical protein